MLPVEKEEVHRQIKATFYSQRCNHTSRRSQTDLAMVRVAGICVVLFFLLFLLQRGRRKNEENELLKGYAAAIHLADSSVS